MAAPLTSGHWKEGELTSCCVSPRALAQRRPLVNKMTTDNPKCLDATESHAAPSTAMQRPQRTATSPRFRNVLCLDDFELAARKYLPRPIFGYIAGAAETQRSLRDNRLAF